MRLWPSVYLFCISPLMATACSCSPGDGCWSNSDQGLAFVGRALKVHSISYDTVSVDFAVSEGFGKLSGKKTLTVYTYATSAGCGYPFRAGVEYFVSANYVQSRLRTDKCSLTSPANVAAAYIHQLRAIQMRKPPAKLFGFVAVEPYPGVSPQSRLETKPIKSVVVTAVGKTGKFRTETKADGTFEFTHLPAATYRLSLRLPKGLFIWWANNTLSRDFAVSPGKMCAADFALYPENDPSAADQPR